MADESHGQSISSMTADLTRHHATGYARRKNKLGAEKILLPCHLDLGSSKQIYFAVNMKDFFYLFLLPKPERKDSVPGTVPRPHPTCSGGLVEGGLPTTW